MLSLSIVIWGCLCYLLVRTSNIDHKKNSKVYHVIFQNNIKVAIHQLFNNLTVTEVIQRVWRKMCTGLGDWLYKHDSQDSILFFIFLRVCAVHSHRNGRKCLKCSQTTIIQEIALVWTWKIAHMATFQNMNVLVEDVVFFHGSWWILFFFFFFFTFGNWWDTTQANLTEILWRPEMPWYKVSPWNTLGWFLWICPFRLHESYCPNWCKWSSSVSGLFFCFWREESNTFDLSVGQCCGHRLRLWAIGSNGDTSSWNEFSL